MQINAVPHSKRLFRLRTILMIVMLAVLILPLGSLYFLRFYENELVRKTEIELIAQSAVFAALYRELINQNHVDPNDDYQPITPQLDLSNEIIMPRRTVVKSDSNHQLHAEHSLAKVAGETMQNILLSTQKVTLAGMRILDKNGVVVAGQNELGMSLAHIKEVQGALKGNYTVVLRERVSKNVSPPVTSLSRGAGIRIFTAFPIIDQGQVYGVVYLSRTPQNILKHLYSIRGRVMLLVILLLGITSLIVVFLSSRLSRPIRELIKQTQTVTQGETDTVHVIKKPGTYELAELSNSFAEMSQALHDRSQYINQFASHVSHEFKTPLTSMQGTLELLKDHQQSMPIEQQQHFLENLQQDTERLKDLVNRLLQQARADTLRASSENSDLLLLLGQLQSQYVDKKLTLVFDNDDVDHAVNIKSNDLESVLSNLFDNSLQHEATQIKITAKQDNNTLYLNIHDNGTGISAANKDRIFTPFFTTRRDKGGTGLGLGIVSSTLKTWGGTIELNPSDTGTLFVLQLNCADIKD